MGALGLKGRKANGQATARPGPHERRSITPEGSVDNIEVDVEPIGLVGCAGNDANGLVVPIGQRLTYDCSRVKRTRSE